MMNNIAVLTAPCLFIVFLFLLLLLLLLLLRSCEHVKKCHLRAPRREETQVYRNLQNGTTICGYALYSIMHSACEEASSTTRQLLAGYPAPRLEAIGVMVKTPYTA